METPAGKVNALPADVQQALEQFCAALQGSLGPRFVSAILYGGLARGEYTPGRSDVNVLVVVRESSLEVLELLRPALEAARLQIPLALMILAEADLAGAADVFAVKFLDIQRHHRTLSGRDLCPELNVTPERLRRQCARELMNLRLRLRQFYVQRGHRPELVETTLSEMVTPFLVTLGVLLELKTGAAPSTPAEAASRTGQLSLDRGVVEEVLALKQGRIKPDAAGLRKLYGEFLGVVEQAGRGADSV